MSDIIEGKNVLVYVNGDTPQEIGCGKTCAFSFKNEIIGKTAFNSGIFPKRRVRMSDCSATISGVTRSTSNVQLSAFYFLQEGVRRSEIPLLFVFEDNNGDFFEITMTALLEVDNITGNKGEFSLFDLNLVSTGGFEMGPLESPVAPDGFELLDDWWLSVDGLDYLDVATPSNEKGYTLTADDVILLVTRTGRQFDEVTGTPGNRQYKFNTGTLQIEFAPANPFNAGETVYVLFLRPI